MQYKRIVSWLEHESSLQGGEEEKAKALRLAAHLNLAMCYLKLQEPSPALENCDKVCSVCSCIIIQSLVLVTKLDFAYKI